MLNDRRQRLDAVRRDPRSRERAIALLWHLDASAGIGRDDYLYAILDAARDPRIYPGLQHLAASEHILPLYQGRSAVELAAVAPYLVCLGTTGRVFDWIWHEGWGNSWGIFLRSVVTPETLRAHFRRLTLAQTVEGTSLLFRFYDPRVLRVFLPTCDPAQLREMFGPVLEFSVETEGGKDIVVMRQQADRLVSMVEPLSTGSPMDAL